MRLFATRQSAFSPGMAPSTSVKVPLTGSSNPSGGPPTYETFASRLAPRPTRRIITTGEAEEIIIENVAVPPLTYARRPFSSPNENGLPLPPPDLKRLQRIIWQRRIRTIFPPMSQKFVERLRLAAPHILLFIATAVYGIVGAIIIYRIEKPHEQNHIFSHSKAIIDAQVRGIL